MLLSSCVAEYMWFLIQGRVQGGKCHFSKPLARQRGSRGDEIWMGIGGGRDPYKSFLGGRGRRCTGHCKFLNGWRGGEGRVTTYHSISSNFVIDVRRIKSVNSGSSYIHE